MELGCDCLGVIEYLDAHVVNHDGEPRTIKNAVCVHEEDFGVNWLHNNTRGKYKLTRRSRRLVVSSFFTVGNYDYGFFWCVAPPPMALPPCNDIYHTA